MKKIQERAEIDMLEDPAALARHELPVVSGVTQQRSWWSALPVAEAIGNKKEARTSLSTSKPASVDRPREKKDSTTLLLVLF